MFCFLVNKRYKDRYFSDALVPQIRGLLSDVLATGLKQQEGEKSLAASGSKPSEKVPRNGSLNAMYAELLDGDRERGGSDISSSVESLPIRASYQQVMHKC